MSAQDVLRDTLDRWVRSLTDAGASYGAALDLIGVLLAVKIDDELTQPPHSGVHVAPEGARWPDLVGLSGQELLDTLTEAVRTLGTLDNALGLLTRTVVVTGTPTRLAALISDIDRPDDHVGASWETARRNVLAPAYDRLLVEAAADITANVLFVPTPRPLGAAVAQVLQPDPNETFHDPTVGSGGLLTPLAARARAGVRNRSALTGLRDEAFTAVEVRPDTTRWVTFNLFLHGIGTLGGSPRVDNRDSLARPPDVKVDVVVGNPEFGRADQSFAGAVTAATRDDIRITGNQQLDILQHAVVTLKPGGRGALILPDNVLFEGGAGETVRRHLLDSCDLHTMLRLPTGITHKGGVKANVLFFDRKPAREKPWTERTWVYDLRTNMHLTPIRNPLTAQHIAPFVEAYRPGDIDDREETERFKVFAYNELIQRDKVNLDLIWLTDDTQVDTDDLHDPDVLAREIADDLLAAHLEFAEIADELEDEDLEVNP